MARDIWFISDTHFNQENSRHHKIKPMSNIVKRGNSHRVCLCINGVSTYFGSYPTLGEAQNRRDEVRLKHFGDFAGVYST